MAVGRDALEGVEDGLRSIGAALRVFGNGLLDIGSLCARVTSNSVRASYDLAGQYTYPIEKELTGTEPPSFSDVPLPGIVALSLPVIVPTVILSVTVVPLFANSIASIPRMFVNVANLALLDTNEDQLQSSSEERGALRLFYGLPGSLIGGLGGLISIPFTLLIRFFTNTFKSFIYVFVSCVNLALEWQYQIFLDWTERSFFSHGLGVLGVLGGAIFGVVGMFSVGTYRFLAKNFYSASRAFRICLNLALPTIYRFVMEEDTRSTSEKWVGTIGTGLGAICGVLGYFLVNSGRNMVMAYKVITNFSLPTRMEINVAAEDRHLLYEAIGSLGYIPGLFAGVFSCFAIGIVRFVANTGLGFWSALRIVTNVGLSAEKAFKPLKEKYEPDLRFGFLGFGLGAIAGALVAMIASTAISFTGSFLTVTNLALHTDDKIKLGNDTRSKPGKFIGFLGLTGALVGLLGAFTVAICRLFLNLSGSFKKYFYTSFNYCLPTAALNEIPAYERPWYLGLVGMVIGVITGTFAAIIVSSVLSFFKSYAAVTSLALHPENKIKFSEDRTKLGEVLGCFGLVVGGLAALISIPFIGLVRFVTNTCKSFAKFFLITLNWGLPTDDQNEISEEKRNWVSRTLGIFGIITGSITGALLAVCVSSIITGASIFVAMTNRVLDREDAIPLEKCPRSLGTHILGAPGIIAVIGGLISMAVISIVRWAYHTGCSYLALSGSLLNAGLRRAFFDGLGGDDRSLTKKLVGSLGYLAAAITATPASLFIFVLRQVPTALSITLGLVFSPLVALYKAGGTLRRHLDPQRQRFQPGELIIQDRESVIQGFKNLYSSLSSWGKLVPGKHVAIGADGNKSRWTFFRKSISFNARTVAERTLDTLLEDYRAYAENDAEGAFGMDFFKGEDFNASLEKVKEYYKSGCCVSTREISDVNNEINKLGIFIKTYFNNRHVNEDIQVEDVRPPGGIAWRVAFWGAQRPSMQVAIIGLQREEVAAVSEDALLSPGRISQALA